MCDCEGGEPLDAVCDGAQTVCRACGVVVEAHVFDDRAAFAFEFVQTTKKTSKKRLRDEPVPKLDDAVVTRLVAQFRLETTSSIACLARELYRDFADAQPLRGELARSAAAAVAVYFAFKMEGAPRELRVTAACAGVGKGKARKVVNATAAAFRTALATKPYFARMHDPLDPHAMLAAALDRASVGLDVAYKRRVWSAAQRIAADAFDCGRRPRTLCSGILQIAAQNAGLACVFTREVVAAACDVCPQTVDKATATLTAHVHAHVSLAA